MPINSKEIAIIIMLMTVSISNNPLAN
jgi:hypothetical protein